VPEVPLIFLKGENLAPGDVSALYKAESQLSFAPQPTSGMDLKSQ